MAEAVRRDSSTYPRPTPTAVFAEAPYGLSLEEIEAAVNHLLDDPAWEDIEAVTASDGSRFLFSSRHMDAALAASRAEWMAVGRRENP
jgi:hypothetical protein